MFTEKISKQKKPSKQYRDGNLQLINSSRMFLSPSKYNIIQKVSDF